MVTNNITIIGLGLIGGSIARALHDKLDIRSITAVDSDKAALTNAMHDGVISKGFTDLDSSIYDSDIIFICTPVSQTIHYIDKIAPYVSDKCIITDVCSTKDQIMSHVEAMNRTFCFIGGHPMAGTEKSGYENSFSHLFENAYYVLTPCACAPSQALDILRGIIESFGAIPIVMNSGEHDRVTGSISHLPHIIAATLVNLVNRLDSGDGRMQTLAAGGFKDITRIASSDPEMWQNIVLSNKEQLMELTALFENSLKEFTGILKREDSDAIYDYFDTARKYRNSISSRPTGLLQPLYRLVVDVQDKPGIIGEIATLLGNHNINIKNIHVTNSREFEQGCLIIALPDITSVEAAFNALVDAGYKVYKDK